ncbi:thioredoxin family protein [Paenibacillus prosopidis]|uniref:Thioredoxin-like protein n=1 Tax=Paenibacillus prosopidis TaxID=630520 RepID=A0A368W413_9BACL|nr:thioredoxin family protein [Paenibacillus prosopidis]RCW49028.1 hypothetical protein DFP97_105213 [Paenibacillus prosopidis]
MGKSIEIFTDSSLYGEDIVERVKEYACPRCSILIYDANGTESSVDMQSKVSEYGVTSMPAIVIDGKLIHPDKLVKGKLNLFYHIFNK